MMVRRGISLLEVLFSVGVIVIGLLGVLLILPVALLHVGVGNVADRGSRVGLNAIEEFDIRGLSRPDSWLYADGTPVLQATRYVVSPNIPMGYAFCIDPRFTAAPANLSGTVPFSSAAAPYYDARFFPYYSPSSGGVAYPAAFGSVDISSSVPQVAAEPRMLRLTARSFPGTGGRMPQLMAEKWFSSEDDLIFTLPKDRDLAAVQDYKGLSTRTGDYRRQSQNSFSWMATLVPRGDTLTALRSTYLLSVVVFSNRETSLEMYRDNNGDGIIDPGELPSNNERTLSVVNPFQGAGFTGGEVTLEGASPEAVDLRAGTWIMLAGSTTDAAGTDLTPDFRWYRIVGIDADPQFSAGNYQVDVTLQGSHWLRSEWHVATTNARFRPTQATVVKGVVAVYEKMIQLETTSLWN